MRCPSNKKVIKSDSKGFLAIGGLHEDHLCDALQEMTPTNQCQNGSSNRLTPNRERPRLTHIFVAYPRPAFSATKRTNHAPISFNKPKLIKAKESWNTEVHGGGGLELVKPAREPASIQPSKTCASPKNAPRTLLVRCSLLALVGGRKNTGVRHQLFPQKPPGSRL